MIDIKYIENLSKTINEAQEEIKKNDVKDNGSCNLNTVIFDFSGWKTKEFNKLTSLCGISFGEKMKGLHNGYRFLFFELRGMANLRTSQVESAKKYLCDKGFNCSIWYQLD